MPFALQGPAMLTRLRSLVRRKLLEFKNKNKAKGKQKIFCIGRNKTGTTSLKRAFEDLGYPVGDQRKAEILTEFPRWKT